MSANEPHIAFACACGHRFRVWAELAGTAQRCPECGALCEVPEADDAELIDDDGALLLKPEEPASPRGDRVAQAARFFGRGRRAPDGSTIDLRQSLSELADAELSQQPPRSPAAAATNGKHVEPFAVAPDPYAEALPGEVIPVAQRVIGYAEASLPPANRIRDVLLQLCQPTNLFVLLFAWMLAGATQVAALISSQVLLFLMPVAALLAMMVAAHFGNALDEVGPQGIDELPAPVRGLGLMDDLWDPFRRFAGALAICYGPAILVARYAGLDSGWGPPLAALASIAGSVAFPAVFLTTCTSGSLGNLRPDRLIGVMRATGPYYVISVVAWLLAAGAAVISTISTFDMVAYACGSAGASRPPIAHPLAAAMLLLAAVFLSHFFCWHLGLLYRGWHAQFPWIMQFHLSTRARDEREQATAIRAQRRKVRYVPLNNDDASHASAE